MFRFGPVILILAGKQGERIRFHFKQKLDVRKPKLATGDKGLQLTY